MSVMTTRRKSDHPNAHPKKTPEQEYKDALAYYDNRYTTLVDYVCIIGVSTEDIKQAILNKDDKTLKFTPTVLSRVPDIDKASIAFAGQVTEFCFPDKIAVSQIAQTKYQELVLTSADGQSIYAVAMIFSEDLAHLQEGLGTYEEIYRQAEGNQEYSQSIKNAKFQSSMTTRNVKLEKTGSYKSPMGKSRSKEDQDQEEEKSIATNTGDFAQAFRRHSYLHSETKNLSFADLSFFENERISEVRESEEKRRRVKEELIEPNRYFISKSLCLMSRQPFFEQFKSILYDLKKACEIGLKAPLEDYLTHLVFSVPSPPRGIAKVNVHLVNQDQIQTSRSVPFTLPPINHLPHTNPEFIRTLFDSLDIDNILLFFKRVLLDTNNVIISKQKGKLVQVGEALRSLVYPFKFEFIYVPFLPAVLQDYLNAPVPYLMGIEESLLKNAEDDVNDGTYLINLDNNTLIMKGHQPLTLLTNPPKTKPQVKDDLPEFPIHYGKKLAQNLNLIISQKKKRGAGSKLTDLEVQAIRENFFRFFVAVLQRFTDKEMWQSVTTKGSLAIEDVTTRFDIERFIESSKNDQKPFMRQFCKLQMFTRLLERKVWPTKNEDMIDLLYLEDHIRLKLNRYIKNIKKKLETSFLDDAATNKTIVDFNCDILQKLNKKLKPDLLKQFYKDQEIMPFTESSIEDIAQQGIYQYYVIPQKLNTLYLREIFQIECRQRELLKQFQEFQDQQVKKLSMIGSTDQTNRKQRIQSLFEECSIETNVYLCWVLMWASTLSYQDETERLFRFKQVLEVLEKLQQQNCRLGLEIFEIMMDSIYKYGNYKMILELYDAMEDFRLKPNAAIMTYLFQSISKSNHTMDEAQKIFKKRRKEKREQQQLQGNTDLQRKMADELKRRVDSSKRGTGAQTTTKTSFFGFLAGGHSTQPSTQTLHPQKQDHSKPVIQISIEQLNRGEKPTKVGILENKVAPKKRSDTQEKLKPSTLSAQPGSQTQRTQATSAANSPVQKAKLSYLDYRNHKIKGVLANYRKRNLLKPDEQEEYLKDNVVLLLKEKCSECGVMNGPKEILKYSVREMENFYTFRCKCTNPIIPNLIVRIGMTADKKKEDTTFINPIQVRYYLEERLQIDDSYRNANQIDPESLRCHNKNIYWNLIWNFAEMQLPYDFMVPYEEQTEYLDFLKLNKHLKVRNKLRLEALVEKEGGVENYLAFMEKKCQQKEHEQQSRKHKKSELSVQYDDQRLSLPKSKKKGKGTRKTGVVKKKGPLRQTLINGKRQESFNIRGGRRSSLKRRAKSADKQVLEKL